jgi:NTE family protein
MNSKPPYFYDVVMEGGGVKGIGLVGALSVLEEHGYVPKRVAGTSAAAIVGALLAAGAKLNDIHLAVAGFKYSKFKDENLLDKFGPFGKMLSLVVYKGVYEGRYLRKDLEMTLKNLGVHTFDDLRITEPWAKSLPPHQRYKLVVLAADVTRGQLARLPWDYNDYGLDPGKQRIADAVRASMSIPFFYTPLNLRQHLLVDGSILTKFPIDLFDMTPAWPTIGIKLRTKPEATSPLNRTRGALEYGQAVLSTMLNGRDQLRFDDPATMERTIYVDTENISTTNFDISLPQLERIYVNGRHAAEDFLKSWDFEAYKAKYHVEE